MKPITEIDDPRLVKGLAHPLRIHILRVLQDRVASPSEIAGEIDAPLGNVSYHVRFLARVGLIELATTKPRRGAVEHYYRSVGRPKLSDKTWGKVPSIVKDALVGSALADAGEMIATAAQGGGFDRDRAHVGRNSYTLDDEGFAELAAAMSDLLTRADRIEQESKRRSKAAGHATGAVPVGMVTLLFEGGRTDARAVDADGDGHGGSAPPRRRAARKAAKTT